MKSGLKNTLTEVLAKKDSESSTKKGEASTIEEVPYKRRIELANLRKQMVGDAKTMKKSEFYKKYSTLSKPEFKELRSGDIDDLYTNSRDFWNAESEDKDIIKFTNLQKKQEDEEKQLGLTASAIAGGYKGYMSDAQKLKLKKDEIQKKYPGVIDNPLKPVDYKTAYEQGILADAKKLTSEKDPAKAIGIPLPNDETHGKDVPGVEQMTCITGVCTLANDQGVSFEGMKNTGGVQYDKDRKAYIPVSNNSFKENLDKTGYEEIPIEDRKPSDFIQYIAPDHQHMEIMLNQGKDNVMTSFNNYGLSNYGQDEGGAAGLSTRKIQKNAEGKNVQYNLNPNTGAWEENFKEIHVYRPKKETYEAAYMKKYPEYAAQFKTQNEFNSSDDAKAYGELNKTLGDNKAFDALGEDAALFKNAEGDVSKYKDANEMKAALLKKAKNTKLVSSVIDKLYSN